MTEYIKNIPPGNESPENFKSIQMIIETLDEDPLRELAEHQGLNQEEIKKMVPGEIREKLLAVLAGKDSLFYKDLEGKITELQKKYNKINESN